MRFDSQVIPTGAFGQCRMTVRPERDVIAEELEDHASGLARLHPAESRWQRFLALEVRLQLSGS